MKLLFDQNLSPRIVLELAELYAGSDHVQTLGLGEASDLAVWEVARQENFTVVTRDTDFNELSLIRGFPPKVIWIRRGNCTTREIMAILRHHHQAILEFENDPAVGVLELF